MKSHQHQATGIFGGKNAPMFFYGTLLGEGEKGGEGKKAPFQG